MVKQRKFEQLGLLYIIALAGIAVTIILSQLIIQNYIGKQKNDPRIINIAGQQRMLSQKISKIVLQIEYLPQDTGSVSHLRKTLDQWINTQEELLSGINVSTPRIKNLNEEITPHFQAIADNTERVLMLLEEQGSRAEFSPYIDAILEHEVKFLRIMDEIVAQHDQSASMKLSRLKYTGLLLLGLALAVIIAEFLFIFRPIALNVRETVSDLMISEERSLNMAGEMSRLYEELMRSYQDLESVNLKPPVPMVFATVDKRGAFTFISDNFRRLLEFDQGTMPSNVEKLLLVNDYSQAFVHGLLDIINKGNSWNGEIKLTTGSGDFCWLEVFIVPIRYENNQEHKFIGRDISEIKEATYRSREINRARIESRVREQEYRSVLILEGQEEERQRLGREIHDGIGQMLTALKLSLESITPSSSKHTVRRLQDTRDLMKRILKEVRRISFNLTPSSLSDFGIVPAVKKFCQEVDRLSAPQVMFINKTHFVNRLEQHIENNLYRIIQEGVNNAIKYASAATIKVIFEHDPRSLKITIADDGKGFDYKALKNSGHFRSAGHGIYNMKERTAFIHGKFDLLSEQGKGTQIMIDLPLDIEYGRHH